MNDINKPLALRWRLTFACERCGCTWRHSLHADSNEMGTEMIASLSAMHEKHREACRGN